MEQSILERITLQYPSFSSSQKRIADYILKNPHEACFLSLKQMSEKVLTTEKTIINFTKKIGLESYILLKKDLQCYISMRISPDEKMMQAVSTIKETHEEFVNELYRADISCMNKSMECLNISELMAAIEILSNATRVVVLTHNIAGVVNQFLSYRMRSLGIEVKEIDVCREQEYLSAIYHMKPTDVLFVSSFPRYDNTLIAITQLVKERGHKIIAFTDSLTSPVANAADISFLCSTDTAIFYNSFSSSMMLANILASTLARYMDAAVIENKKQIAEIKNNLTSKIERII